MALAMHIKNFLHKHDRLYYLYKFVRNFSDPEFFKRTNLTRFQQINDFNFHKLGDMNDKKPIYLIKLHAPSGLMSFLYNTARYLVVADYFRFVPVIEWKSAAYQRDDHNSFGDNIFEYWFEQPGGISVSDASQSRQVALSTFNHGMLNYCNGCGYMPYSEIDTLHIESVCKHLRLNSFIQSHITKATSSVLGNKKTLGVHHRSFNNMKHKWHPVGINATEYIPEIKKAIDEHGFERIFLAADNDNTVKLFKSHFGNMVVYYDGVARVVEGKSSDLLHQLLDARESRIDHGYNMGLEVITDVYTLAACQGLIAGQSAVSKAALYVNGNKFDYMNILYKGIYGIDVPIHRSETNNIHRMYQKRYRKMLKQQNSMQ